MKYYGNIGYAETEEISPGVYVEKIVEYPYYGDVIDFGRSLQSSDKINDDMKITNQLSIVADDIAYKNMCNIRYAEFMGSKWKISQIKVLTPRLLLTLGDLWNGPTA